MSNQKNPAVRRILGDVKELNRHPSSRYSAAPLENNMFEWHFTIRGPKDSAFEGGMYHGRILLPAEYPFKPPNIVFLTKNGRFEVGTKICLSISAYHEESWQPAWGVRTMLEAIISFLPSEGAGAIGALDWTKEERKKLAIESHNYCCPICGPISALLSDPSTDEPNDSKPDSEIADQIAQLHLSKGQEAPGSPVMKRNTDLVGANLAVGTDITDELTANIVDSESATSLPADAEENVEIDCSDGIPTPTDIANEDCEICEQVMEEAVTPIGELRHRIPHSTTESVSPAFVTATEPVIAPAPAVTQHEPQVDPLENNPEPVVNNVNPPVNVRVNIVRPHAAAPLPRDRVDEWLNIISKLLMVAILSIIYRIVSRQL